MVQFSFLQKMTECRKFATVLQFHAKDQKCDSIYSCSGNMVVCGSRGSKPHSPLCVLMMMTDNGVGCWPANIHPYDAIVLSSYRRVEFTLYAPE